MPKSPDAFRTISEVADWLGVQAHVLRFWESKFNQVKPIKRAGGRRYYRPTDMLLLGGIKTLLHDDGLTIKGVQKILRESGVSHVADLSQPLDDLTMAELGSVAPAAPAPETPADIPEADVAIDVPQAEPEQAVVLPFDASSGEPDPAPEPDDAAVDPAPEAAGHVAAEPHGDDPAPTPEEPAAVEEDLATDGAPEPILDDAPAPQEDAPEPELAFTDAPETTDTQNEEPEPATDTPDLMAEEPQPEADQPVAEEDTEALPSFLRRPLAPIPEAADNAAPADDAQAESDNTPEPMAPAVEASEPEAENVSDPAPAEELDFEAEPTALDDADDAAADTTDAPAEEPQVLRPAVIDIPPLPIEADLPADPAALSAAMRLRDLSPETSDSLRPLLAELTQLRDQMSGRGLEHGKD